MELSLKVPAACQLGNSLKCEVGGSDLPHPSCEIPSLSRGPGTQGKPRATTDTRGVWLRGAQATVRALHTSPGNVTALLNAEIIIKFTLNKAATAWKMFLICQNNIT